MLRFRTLALALAVSHALVAPPQCAKHSLSVRSDYLDSMAPPAAAEEEAAPVVVEEAEEPAPPAPPAPPSTPIGCSKVTLVRGRARKRHRSARCDATRRHQTARTHQTVRKPPL